MRLAIAYWNSSAAAEVGAVSILLSVFVKYFYSVFSLKIFIVLVLEKRESYIMCNRLNINIQSILMLAALMALSLLLAGCDKGSLASGKNGKVTEADFDAYLKYRSIEVRDDKHRQAVLDEYLQREALAKTIYNNHFNDDALIEAELNELRKEVLVSRYFERYLAENASEQAVNNYYNNNIANYEERKVHVAHILLRTNSHMDESQRKVKLTTIQEAYSKIQSGMAFKEAAERYSEDAISAKKGGDLGWVKEGSIAQSFSERAFTLAIDEMSEPFESPFGFHVIQVLEAPQVIRRPYEAVKGEIRYQLRNQYKEAEMKRLMEGSDITLN